MRPGSMVTMQHVPQGEREGFALIYDKARLGNWTTSRTVPVGTHTLDWQHLIAAKGCAREGWEGGLR